MLKILIKPFMKFAKFKNFVQFSYIALNRLIRVNEIRKKSSTAFQNNIEHFNFNDHDTFFGYYDKSPLNKSNTKIIFHASPIRTYFKPNPNKKIKIIVQTLEDNYQRVIAETSAYNWQQGSRLQWVSDNEILFNDYCYDTNKYISYCYNVNSGERIKTFDYPVQDSYFKSMFYSINYNRLQSSRPDYGYFNIPIHTQKELLSLEADGIWEIDFNSEKGKLIISLEEVVGIESYSRYSAGLHWINHLMISPNGKRMIFLHRTRNQGVKRDRLFSYDIETHTLSLIINYSIISHFNWINNDSIICFSGENKADLAYKKINLLTKEITNQDFFKEFNSLDGHPTIQKDTFVTDTYPDFLGFQKLIIVKENVLKILHETNHPIFYFKETRCDLHPRLQKDQIFFDQIVKRRRKLSMIRTRDTSQNN